jgi:hypothetical protein
VAKTAKEIVAKLKRDAAAARDVFMQDFDDDTGDKQKSGDDTEGKQEPGDDTGDMDR